jgi:hypothetical protein
MGEAQRDAEREAQRLSGLVRHSNLAWEVASSPRFSQ